MDKTVGVGVAVLVIKNKKLLMIKRNSPHGHGTWCPPGGHVDFGESPEEAAIRECFEETNIEGKNPRFLTYTNDVFYKTGKHYITLWFKLEYSQGEIDLKDPEEVMEIQWVPLDEIPENRFLPLENFLKTKEAKFLFN